MKITLEIAGEKKDFYSRGLTAGASLAAFDLQMEIEEMVQGETGELYSPGHRERMLRFVVDLFGGQFTEQQFLEGFQDSFFAAVPAMLRSVVEGVNAAVQEFPAPNAEAPRGKQKKA